MDIRTIVVPVSGTDDGLPSVDTAFRIGRHFGAHVEGVHARRDTREALAYIGEGMTGAIIEELIATAEQDSAALAERARRDFAAACDGAGFEQAPPKTGRLTARLVVETGRESERIAIRGRLADLIVVARAAKDAESPMRATLEAALLESGRALFVAPAGGIEQAPSVVAIGWNGSAEAARAVAHAMPFLKKAGRVAVISVEEGVRPGPSADDLVAYLAMHDVAAASAALKSGYRSTGEALLSESKAMDAGLLVMGAYTHSRLRRMIFGSATEYMLGSADIPLLMMH